MSKEIIAVDIDEVLFPMAPTFLAFHNTMYGSEFTVDQMQSYYIEEMTGETWQQVEAKIDAYLETEHYKQGQPVVGSVEAIKQLREKYKLVLITSRHFSYRGTTESFIEEHFTGLFDDLRYTHLPEDPELVKPKHIICKELGSIALIDDSVSNVFEAAQNGITGILFGDYAWNKSGVLPAGVIRCKDWPAVVEYFDGRG